MQMVDIFMQLILVTWDHEIIRKFQLSAVLRILTIAQYRLIVHSMEWSIYPHKHINKFLYIEDSHAPIIILIFTAC